MAAVKCQGPAAGMHLAPYSDVPNLEAGEGKAEALLVGSSRRSALLHQPSEWAVSSGHGPGRNRVERRDTAPAELRFHASRQNSGT